MVGQPRSNRWLTSYADKHIAYVVRMVYKTAERLWQPGEVKDRLLHNALLESYALNSRTLYQFFHRYGKRRRSDVGVEDYLPSGIDPAAEFPQPDCGTAAQCEKAGKLVAHLTEEREEMLDGEKQYFVHDMAKYLHTLVERLTEVADPQRLGTELQGIHFPTLPDITSATAATLSFIDGEPSVTIDLDGDPEPDVADE